MGCNLANRFFQGIRISYLSHERALQGAPGMASIDIFSNACRAVGNGPPRSAPQLTLARAWRAFKRKNPHGCGFGDSFEGKWRPQRERPLQQEKRREFSLLMPVGLATSVQPLRPPRQEGLRSIKAERSQPTTLLTHSVSSLSSFCTAAFSSGGTDCFDKKAARSSTETFAFTKTDAISIS